MAEVAQLVYEGDPEGWRGELIRHAKSIASYDKPGSELVGFMVVGIFSDGAHSAGFRWDPERSPVPRRLMPAYIEEIVREEIVTDRAAQEAAVAVFNQGPI